MMQWILATDGRPFPNRRSASQECDRLAAQLGPDISPQVIPHPEGGFAVLCCEVSGEAPRTNDFVASSVPARPATAAASEPRALARAAEPAPSGRLYLRPARRARWGQFFVAVLGVYIAWMPREVLHLAGFQLPTSPVLADLVVWYVLLAGVALASASAIRILWYPMANTYLVDHQGVTKTEWCWDRGLHRSSCHLDFEQLRSVYLAQSLFDRLLNVGTLRLVPHSAMERTLMLGDLPAPAGLEAEIGRRILAAPLRGPRRFRDSARQS